MSKALTDLELIDALGRALGSDEALHRLQTWEQLVEALEWATQHLNIAVVELWDFGTGRWACGSCGAKAYEQVLITHHPDCCFGKAKAALEAAKEDSMSKDETKRLANQIAAGLVVQEPNAGWHVKEE